MSNGRNSLPCLLNFDQLPVTLNINYDVIKLNFLVPNTPVIYTNQTVPTISGTFSEFTVEESQVQKVFSWFDSGFLLYKIPHFNKVPQVAPQTESEFLTTNFSLTPQTIVFVSKTEVIPYRRFHFPHAHFNNVLNGNLSTAPTILNPADFKVNIAPTQDSVNMTQNGKLVTFGAIDWQVVPRDTTQLRV